MPKSYTTEYGVMGYIPGRGYILFDSEKEYREYLEMLNLTSVDEEESDADQN